MNRTDFCKATGASRTQVDYWARSGMEICEGESHCGSGAHRVYKTEAIPAVTLLVEVSKEFGTHFPVDLLIQIFEDYWEECTKIGRVWLTWRVNRDAGPYASSRTGG